MYSGKSIGLIAVISAVIFGIIGKDMIEAGLQTALLVGEKVILSNGELHTVKNGIICK